MIETQDSDAGFTDHLDGALLSTKEQAMLADFEDQRRLQLLRIVVPALFTITLLALPFALLSSVQTHSIFAIIIDLTGVIPCSIGLWALRKPNVDLAAATVFVGVTGSIIVLVCGAGFVGGTTDLATLAALSMFILPIAITSLLGTPRLVIYITAGVAIFTLLFFLVLPHSNALRSALQGQNAALFILIPLGLQITFGVLMYAVNIGFLRVHRELGDMRVAYAREKELDRLKDYFISSVNHELRTPIMALQGYIVLARELAARRDIERQERLLARGEEAIKHLANLVESVLDVKRLESNVQPMHITTFDLHPVIMAATTMLDPRDAAQKERPLHLIVPGEIRIYADEDRVRQVLINLLSNACKYSVPGSPIEIAARIQPQEGKRHRNEQAMIEVMVRDYGLGIPPDQAPLLFQRFVRLERDIASSVVGAGLGLAICKSYIEEMGGQIWAKSRGIPGEGSAFYFTLPAGA